MSESIVAVGTQRKALDVVMELVQLHIQNEYKQGNHLDSDDIEKLFIKYYKLYSNRNSF